MTDLDGTLLDHDTYSYEAAMPALSMLRERRIPLILNTSKTAAEVAKWQAELAPGMPYIVENGAAVILPVESQPRFLPSREADGSEYRQVFGLPRAHIIEQLQPLLAHYDCDCFHQMSVEDVVATTGLDIASAKLSMQRDYSEPALWHDSEEKLAALTDELAERGVKVIRGGRFVHFIGAGNKGKAMGWLAAQQTQRPKLIALGDSDNDRPMLEASDSAVVIRRRGKASLKIQHGNQQTTKAIGPAGWNQALLPLICRRPDNA